MRAIQLRGEGTTYECPACHEQHRSIMRIDGVAVLACPTATPGMLHLFTQPAPRNHLPSCFIVGPQPEPAEPAKEPEAPRAPEPVHPFNDEKRQRRSA